MSPLRRTLNQLTNLALAAFILGAASSALEYLERAHTALVALRLVGG